MNVKTLVIESGDTLFQYQVEVEVSNGQRPGDGVWLSGYAWIPKKWLQPPEPTINQADEGASSARSFFQWCNYFWSTVVKMLARLFSGRR